MMDISINLDVIETFLMEYEVCKGLNKGLLLMEYLGQF